jgi:hypothetical protein
MVAAGFIHTLMLLISPLHTRFTAGRYVYFQLFWWRFRPAQHIRQLYFIFSFLNATRGRKHPSGGKTERTQRDKRLITSVTCYRLFATYTHTHTTVCIRIIRSLILFVGCVSSGRVQIEYQMHKREGSWHGKRGWVAVRDVSGY